SAETNGGEPARASLGRAPSRGQGGAPAGRPTNPWRALASSRHGLTLRTLVRYLGRSSIPFRATILSAARPNECNQNARKSTATLEEIHVQRARGHRHQLRERGAPLGAAGPGRLLGH